MPRNNKEMTQLGLTLGAATAASQNAQAGLTADKSGVRTPGGGITVRQAGGLQDLRLPVSPRTTPINRALQNMAKAINLALTHEFLETPLDDVYVTARVRKGTVEILHGDYFGLGDGVFAVVGKIGKSIQLTFRGPDPASPEGRKRFEQKGRSMLGGLFDLLGRKLNLLQEYEDQVPTYVEQMLDRLEAANMIEGWDRDDWEIDTTVVGLDVIITPKVAEKE
jgi:hypothetical protein